MINIFSIHKTSFCTLQSVTIHDFMNLLLMRTNSRNLLRSAAALQWIFSFSCTKLISIGISGRVCLTLLGLLQCASAFLCILRFDAVPWQWHLDDILMSGLKWPPAVAVNEVPGHMNNYWQEWYSDIQNGIHWKSFDEIIDLYSIHEQWGRSHKVKENPSPLQNDNILSCNKFCTAWETFQIQEDNVEHFIIYLSSYVSFSQCNPQQVLRCKV